jgi:hypothetical protein
VGEEIFPLALDVSQPSDGDDNAQYQRQPPQHAHLYPPCEIIWRVTMTLSAKIEFHVRSRGVISGGVPMIYEGLSTLRRTQAEFMWAFARRLSFRRTLR